MLLTDLQGMFPLYWALINAGGNHVYVGPCPECLAYADKIRVIISSDPKSKCDVCGTTVEGLMPLWRYEDEKWITEPGSRAKRISIISGSTMELADQKSDAHGAMSQ